MDSNNQVLEVSRGGQSREYTLDKEMIFIGRGPENDIVLIDKYVSGRHAKLQWTKGYLYLVDLNSTNGTELNGSRLDKDVPYTFKTGDVIGIGDFTLTLHARKTADTPRAGSPAPEKARPAAMSAAQPAAGQSQNILSSIWVRSLLIVIALAAIAVLAWLILPMFIPELQSGRLPQPTTEPVASSNVPQQVQATATSASLPFLITYVNTASGYRVVYPDGWQIDSSQAGNGATIISEMPDKSAEITINVQQQTLAASLDTWLKVIDKVDPNSKILRNEKGTGVWDWYLSWDGTSLGNAGITMHNESFFKTSGGSTYMLWTHAPAGKYDSYPYQAVISSFQLTAQ